MIMIRPLVLLTALAAPVAVNAATYSVIDSEKSEVVFRYEQMGVKMDGRFTALDGDIIYDSEKPENASLTLRVKVDSADAGSDEANDEIVKKEWFDAQAFPLATFVAKTVTPKADNELQVEGTLDIKGHQQQIQFPVKVLEENGKVTFTGSFPLLRGDYAIGEGPWSAYDIVANDIQIDFNVIATE